MITASIVLYNENLSSLKKTINSFLNTNLKKKLFLIDNSTKKTLEKHFKHPEIEYVFVGKNIGFGKAHNLIISKLDSDYHLILNPDVEFDSGVIPCLMEVLKNETKTSFITPKVLYPNKELQFICRKHPTIFDLINRKFRLSKDFLHKNEYRNRDFSQPFNPEFIHGCFMFFKTEDFKALNGFDKRYFLYLEDADICREIQKLGKKILYYPEVAILHKHQKGSSKSIKLFFYHLSSAFKYFLKWGF